MESGDGEMTEMARARQRWDGCAGYLFVVSSLFLAACGTSPSQPSGPLPTPTLSAGNYTLRIDSGNTAGAPTICGTLSINGQAVSFNYAALPVVVTTDGTVWTLRPTAEADRGLIVTLRVAGATFEGTATGRAVDGLTLLTFGTQGASPEAARLTGSPIQTNLLSGILSGALTFEREGVSGFCTAYSWLLQPR